MEKILCYIIFRHPPGATADELLALDATELSAGDKLIADVSISRRCFGSSAASASARFMPVDPFGRPGPRANIRYGSDVVAALAAEPVENVEKIACH